MRDEALDTISHPEPEIDFPDKRREKKNLFTIITIYISSSWVFRRRLASLR
jgi:hypothetical protein